MNPKLQHTTRTGASLHMAFVANEQHRSKNNIILRININNSNTLIPTEAGSILIATVAYSSFDGVVSAQN